MKLMIRGSDWKWGLEGKMRGRGRSPNLHYPDARWRQVEEDMGHWEMGVGGHHGEGRGMEGECT